MNTKIKFSKYIFELLIMVLALFLATPSLAAPKHDKFVIDALDVHIVVRDDNSYLVTKTYDVTFLKETASILKFLPHRPKGSRENPVEIRGISAGGRQFEILRGKSIRIPIQDAYKGKKEQLTLCYVYDAGDDSQGMNVLRYNLIGRIINYARVDKLTFTIEMPHSFDAGSLSVTRRQSDSIEKDNSSVRVSGRPDNVSGRRTDSNIEDIAEWQVDGTVITGRLKGQIRWNEEVTVTLLLPGGYYTTAAGRIHTEPTEPIGYFVGLAAFLSYLLWLIFGRKKRIPPVESFFPPKGLTPIDVGYVMNGRFDNKDDIISLIVYWAEKGYLHISEIIGKKELQLHKVRNPDADANIDEMSRFVDLFSKENVVQATDSIRNLAKTYRLSAYSYESGYGFQRVKKDLPKVLLVGTPSFVCLWVLLFNLGNPRTSSWLEAVLGTSFITAILIIPLLIAIYAGDVEIKAKTEVEAGIRSIRANFLLVVVFMIAMLLSLAQDSTQTIPLKMLGFLDLFFPLYLMIKCAKEMWAISERENIARLEGFKNSLASGDMYGPTGRPEYFYQVLPYAIALGMTDVLVKKFEHVVLYPPNWFKSNSPGKTFSASSFVSRLLEGL